MRISTDVNDAGYRPDAVMLRLRVFLDDLDITDKGIITVDDDAGEILHYKRDASNKLIVNEDGLAIKETSYGRVRIEG
jgi:hypothetical protein